MISFCVVKKNAFIFDMRAIHKLVCYWFSKPSLLPLVTAYLLIMCPQFFYRCPLKDGEVIYGCPLMHIMLHLIQMMMRALFVKQCCIST
jgi:hypothetical protein